MKKLTCYQIGGPHCDEVITGRSAEELIAHRQEHLYQMAQKDKAHAKLLKRDHINQSQIVQIWNATL